jgi:hypothetical protein
LLKKIYKIINMKKVIIGLSGLVILAVAVILFTNARTSNQVAKKTATEVAKDCGKCPSAATCPGAAAAKVSGPNTAGAVTTEAKTMNCDPAKCKAAGCDMTKCKEGKCDPATCKATAEAKTEMKACPATCPMASKVR